MKANERLSEWRQKQDISQAAAAAKLGVRAATWCDWENARKIPQVDMALALEKLTGGTVKVKHWGQAAAERRAEKGAA